jgi:hypothetical protein
MLAPMKNTNKNFEFLKLLNNESLIKKYQDNHLLICERKNLKELNTVLYIAIKITLESWSMGIVRPVMEVYPYAWLVFVSYIVIVGMIALNLIVGVIVK